MSEVRSFLGICGYYRRFIEKFAEKAKPLTKLTEKGKSLIWTTECQEAFDELKNRLCNAPILGMPDFTKPFLLDTDASNFAIGAVLSQCIDGKERPIAYASRTLTKAERQYCVTRKELLAVVHFCKYFKHYLYGKRFTVRTDHGSLRWLMNFKSPEGQLARWLEVLSVFDMTIEHRPGTQHRNADALSRLPCKQCGFQIDWEKQTVAQVRTETQNQQELKVLQDKDPHVKQVKDWVLSGSRPEYSAISEEGKVLKSLWSQFTSLKRNDGMLRSKMGRSGQVSEIASHTPIVRKEKCITAKS